jgi:hypothetical protein
MLSRIIIQQGDKIKKVNTNVGRNTFHRVKNIMSMTQQQQMSCLN